MVTAPSPKVSTSLRVTHEDCPDEKIPEQLYQQKIEEYKEQKRSMINMTLSNLRLDGDQLRWEYKKPFDTMAFCVNNSTLLRMTVSTESNQRVRA